MTDPVFVIHGLSPMTTKELGRLKCGHCRHHLTMHVTNAGGNTECGICRCYRRAHENILEPHHFEPRT